ncbi:MAG: hypothetical protein Q9175_004946 [Cornicularia normoerica]
MPFPPEVLLLIAKRLRKPDLKKFRLVCRSLRFLVVPLLFDQIAFSPSFRALSLANDIASHFGCHVKTLFYFPVNYRQLTLAEFTDISQNIRDDDMIEGCIRQDVEDGHTDNQSLRLHIEHSFNSYSSRAKEQLDLYRSGRHNAHLIYIMSKIPTAKKLVIAATGSCEHIRIKDMRHLGIVSSDLCPRNDCILSPEDHLNMQPVPHCFGRPEIGDFFHPMMHALHATRSTITELDIQVHKPKKDTSALLAVSAFSASVPQSRYLTNRLSTMTKLRFDLGIDARSTADEEVFNRKDVAKALATARNLECLYISLPDDFEDTLQDPDSPRTFDAILGGCQYPKLKSLVLECFDANEAELLGFLKCSTKLEALYMHDVNLISGSWERIADELRRVMHPKEVELSCLRQDNWAAFVYHTSPSSIRDVGEFFLRQGENPFTAQAIGRNRLLHDMGGPPHKDHALGHWSLERHWRRVMG